MKKALIIAAALLAVVLAGAQLHAEDKGGAAPAEKVTMVKDLLGDVSGEESAAIATELLEAAIEKGGSETAMKNRIAKLVASCIGAAGDNINDVAAALAKAAGEEHCGVVIAAITVATGAVDGDVEAVTEAAVGAAADKETAEDAVENPYAYLGRIRAWRVGRAARRWSAFGVSTTTTTTSTTTTTVPSPTPVGLN